MEQNKREQFIIRRIGGTTYKVRVVFNEWLVRDTSKKIKAVKRAKGMSGKPVTSKPVYGCLLYTSKYPVFWRLGNRPRQI